MLNEIAVFFGSWIEAILLPVLLSQRYSFDESLLLASDAR